MPRGERTLRSRRGCAPSAHTAALIWSLRDAAVFGAYAYGVHRRRRTRANTRKNYGILWMWTRKGGGLIWRDPLLFWLWSCLASHVCVCWATVHFSLFKSVVGPRGILCLERCVGRVLKLIHAKGRMQHGVSSSDLTCLLFATAIPMLGQGHTQNFIKLGYK